MRKILLIFLVCGVCFYTIFIFICAKKGPLESPVTVIINKGDSVKKIANLLAQQNILNNPYIFVISTKFPSKINLKAGEYLFHAHISINEVVGLLKTGEVIIHKVTIPEGITNFEIIKRLEDIPMLTGNIVKSYDEGQLLPETYFYKCGDNRQEILDRMHSSMDNYIEKIWAEKKSTLPYNNPEEVLIMASIIEKEAANEDEKRRIAAVFLNRLKKKMKLQTDPTVIYAITKGKVQLARDLTRADLSYNSPYNTYLYFGLPPSPITNPGMASIEAAVNPLDVDDLYFVADGKGGHNFSNSLVGHNTHVQTYRKNRKTALATNK